MRGFKLTYFDFDGGRAEPARLALKLGGLRFEDVRNPDSRVGPIQRMQ